MLNIVIPMAGAGSRFATAGYTAPKPLISVGGIPMIKLVIHNLRPAEPHRFIFICQNEHVQRYGLRDCLAAWAPGCEVICIDGLTEGAACTVLKARHLIDNAEPLMIANSDQFVDVDINPYLRQMQDRLLDGLIMTMMAHDTKWSYAAIDATDLVTKVAEKQVISEHATVGLYNFKRGADFVSAAMRMIANNERTNGEFYVAPVYNQLIHAGMRIGISSIGQEGNGMYGLGIPADLAAFVQSPVLAKALRLAA